MSNINNNINFQVNYQKGDTSALDNLRKELLELRKLSSNIDVGFSDQEVQKITNTVTILERALNKSFDVNLNTINIQKFTQLLAQSGMNIKILQQNLSMLGGAGNKVFLDLTAQLMQFNTATKQTTKFLDNIANSFFNTIKYTAFNAILNNITGSIQKANGYVKNLDSSLNDIRIVTGKSADEMERFAESANDAAKELAVTTKDYTKGSLIYYQQGLDDETVKTLTDITAMTANVTGQSMEKVSEQLTAVWNGYQVANEAAEEGMQIYQEYVDKMAAVGAATASDLQELSAAMSKVASAASAMGVGFDDLNAQIATIVSVTRQAPESVGTALKTIYARLGDLKVDGVDEFGTQLGEVSEQLQIMGIKILDTNGDMRDMSSVMAEVAEKWDTWTSAQKQAAAIAMAGKRQYNNLVALFDNWDMYGESLKTSMEAAGTLEKQQEIALDSLANKLDQLTATAEDFYDSLINEDTVKGMVESLTKIVQLLADFADATGGLNTLLPMLGSTALQVFNQQIANGLSAIIINMRTVRTEAEVAEQNAQALKAMFSDSSLYVQSGDAETEQARIQGLNQLKIVYGELAQYQSLMTQQEKEQYNTIVNLAKEAGELGIQLVEEEKTWNRINASSKTLNSDLIKDLSDLSKLNRETSKIKNLAADIEQHLNFNSNKTLKNARESIKKAFGGTEYYDAIIDRFNSFNRTGMTAKERIQAIVKELKELGASSEEIVKIKTELDNTKSSAETLANALERNMSTKQMVSNVLGLVGAFGQLATSMQMIGNLGSTWIDDNIDATEKFTQTLIVLGTSIPFVANSLIKMNSIFQSIAKAKELDATITALMTSANLKLTASMTAGEIAQQLINAGIAEETALIYANIIAKRLEEGQTKKLTLAQILLNKARDTGISKATIAIGVLTIIAIAITAVIKARKKYIENIIEESKATLENIKTKEKELEANNELYESYTKLYSQYEKGEDVQQDLYDSAVKLADAYDILDGRLLAVSGRYDELNKKVKEARIQQLEEQRDLAEEGAKTAAKETVNEARSGRGYVRGTKYTYQVGMDTSGKEEKERAKSAIEAVGLENNITDTGTLKVKIDYTDPKAVAQWMKQVDDMITYYKTAFDEADYSKDYFYQQLKKEQKDAREGSEALVEQLKTQYETDTELAFLNNEKQISSDISVSELKKLKDNIKDALDIPEDEVDKYINNYLKGLSEISEQVTKLDLAEKIEASFEEGTVGGIDNTIRLIEQFNDEQLAYLDVHLNNDMLDRDLQSWIDSHQDIIDALGTKGAANKIKTTLGSYQSGETYSQDTVSALYANERVASFMQPSESSFSVMDSSSQLHAVTSAWIESTKAVVQNKEAIESHIKTLQLELEQKAIEENVWENEIEATNGINDIIGENTEYKEKAIEVAKALADGEDTLTIQQKAYLAALMNLDGQQIKDEKVMKEKLTSYGQSIKAAEQYRNSVETLESELKQVTNTTYTYKDASKAIANVIKEENSAIDSIQTAYGNLIDIVDAYNKTGHWTVDNVQKLMELSDEYVASLNMENDSLSLNEQYIQAVTIAKLEEMKQVALDKYYVELDRIALMDNATAAAAAASAALAAGSAFGTMGEQAQQATQQLLAMADAYRETANLSSNNQNALADQARKALENRLKAIDDTINEVSKGGADMKRALKTGKSNSSKKKDKEEKLYQDEFDRYHDLKRAIEELDDALKKLDKDQENLYGKELIRSLKQENELLKEQAGYYEQLAAAQREEAGELQGKLSGYGMTFDATGAIMNYAEATTKALKQYNDAVAQYNAGLLDESAFEVFEKNYEKFKKYLERYETLYHNEMREVQEKLDEIYRKELANNLKAWEVEVQLKLDWKELERGWNDFLHEITADFKKVFKDLRVEMKNMLADAKTYIGADGTLGTIIDAVHDVTGEIDKMMGGGTSDMFESVSQAQEKLKELNSQLQDAAKALRNLLKEAWQNYLDGIDQVADKFDDLMERFERINDELEFQGKLIELLYGDKAYGMMDKLFKAQEKNTKTQIESLKQQADYWEKMFYKMGGNLDDQENWSEDVKKYYENWMEAQGKLNDMVIEYIELLKKDYLNTIEDILSQFDRFISSGSTLDDIATQWERISANAEKYYDSVEGAYYIQTLANKIDKSIADSTDLQAQQKLMKLREKEITYLREKENLTEYDIKAAEARYQIALKEISLEEAQNNKTGMKLTRNEQGNWSYQYVADEEDVANKRQELLDAYNDLYQLASDAYEANLEALQELQQKFIESAREIYLNENLTEEERQQKLLELREWYEDQYSKLAEENQLYRNDLVSAGAGLLLEVYKQDQEAYKNMTGTEQALLDALINGSIDDFMDLEEKIQENYEGIGDKAKDVMEEIRKDWTSGAQTIADLWNKDNGDSVSAKVLQSYDAIKKANEEYQKKVDECARIIERDFSEEGITGAIEKAQQATDSLKDKTRELVTESESYLTDLKNYINQIEDAWESVQQSIKDAIALIEEYLRKVGEANAAATSGVGPSGSGDGSGSGTDGSGSGTGSGGPSAEKEKETYGHQTGKYLGKMTLSEARAKYNDHGYVEDFGGPYIYVEQMKSGGYTGAWNDNSGKLAMLHQKELVLNKDDTKNFLTGINTIRDLSSGLNGSIQNAVLNAVAKTALSLGAINTNGLNGFTTNNNNSNTDNIFNITAEFPNANNVDEIREAILSLPNIASQYVNSTLK